MMGTFTTNQAPAPAASHRRNWVIRSARRQTNSRAGTSRIG